MKKKQKDNLIKAFKELNQPDKEVLLQKIESKKAFGGDFVESQKQSIKKTIRKRRVAWTSFACSFVVIALAIVLISISVFGGLNKSNNEENNGTIGTNVIDYRGSWSFQLDGRISFDDTDKNIKESDIDLIYAYLDDWTIVETQVTQDESAYREYYAKDGITIEVTILLAPRVTSIDSRYSMILNDNYKYANKDNYAVYRSIYFINGVSKRAYIIYLKDQVYIFTSDIDLQDLFE